jgi:hypothetical protein
VFDNFTAIMLLIFPATFSVVEFGILVEEGLALAAADRRSISVVLDLTLLIVN